MSEEIRVRFAPSPTGGLHIGGVRTALFNFLYARHHHGKILLRIEDTDQNRFVPGAEDYILQSMKWLGIEFDEGPFSGGKLGPYRQSERRDIYGQYAQKLIDEKKAYYAFDTNEEIEDMRVALKEANVANPTYNAVSRSRMKNSLTLSKEKVDELLASNTPYVVRLNVPLKEEIRLEDKIHGWIKVLSSTLDDKVIVKSDGMPTYHLANIVDDHLMGITHVIRGDEWLPSAPLHVLLYKYLGWESSMPTFAHLPLILKPEGQGKLSKRDAQKHGFPIYPLNWIDPNTTEESVGFRESGYLPEAMINFLAFLGWNPGTEEELFTMDALIQAFDLDRVGKAGTKFDIQKANWYNQQYLKNIDNSQLVKMIEPFLPDHSPYSSLELNKIVSLMKERVTFPHEIVEKADFLFHDPSDFDEKTVNKKWTAEAIEVIIKFKEALITLENFKSASIREVFQQVIDQSGFGFGKVMPAVRLAITGLGSGPDLMEIIEILGKEKTVKRIDFAMGHLKDKVKVN